MVHPLVDPEVQNFCRRLPKVELHAHLNGCVRDSTVRELVEARSDVKITTSELDRLFSSEQRALQDCFKLFDTIHAITTTHDIITRITREVIEDFAADGVVYLELRTTPKARPQFGMTKASYVAAVLEGLQQYQAAAVNSQLQTHPAASSCGHAAAGATAAPPDGSAQPQQQDGSLADCSNGSAPGLPATSHPSSSSGTSSQNGAGQATRLAHSTGSSSGSSRAPITVKLLLSIDRREDAAAAMDTVQLAMDHCHLGVVGVDLSGNPATGHWSTWLPALEAARAAGLGVTLHAAEVYRPEETAAMLAFRPDRLGHMCALDEALQQQLWASQIPVELCLSSNVATQSVAGYLEHHFKEFYAAAHPVVLCTDDTGVFGTCLSREYAIAAAAFGLDQQQLQELAERSVEYIFAGSDEKQRLRKLLSSF